MVQVSHRPIKEFVVTKFTRYPSPGELARRAIVESSPMAPAHLRWLNGVAYKLTYPAASVISDTFVKEFLDGRVWVQVEYANMPKFTPTIHSEGENVIVPMLDFSGDEDEAVLIGWLKSQAQPSKSLDK